VTGRRGTTERKIYLKWKSSLKFVSGQSRPKWAACALSAFPDRERTAEISGSPFRATIGSELSHWFATSAGNNHGVIALTNRSDQAHRNSPTPFCREVDAVTLNHTGLYRGLYEPVDVDDPYSSRTQLPLDACDVCLMLGRAYPFTIIVISEDAQNYDPRILWHGTSDSVQYAGTCIAADAGVDYLGRRSPGLQHGLEL
jgi:hypothetical protein